MRCQRKIIEFMSAVVVEEAKACSTCRVEKPLTEYHRSLRAADGRQWKCKECFKAHYRDNSDEWWSSNYRRRALRMGVPPKDFGVTRQELVLRDGPGCAKCGTENVPLELDHKIPLVAHGSHSVWNTWLLCEDCHRVKTREDRAVRDRHMKSEGLLDD